MPLLTPNFRLEEFNRTSAPFNNRPGAFEAKNIHLLCLAVLQPLRDHYGKPVVVSSGFRNASVNEYVGGSKTSQHLTGQAADINVAGEYVWDVAKWIGRNCSFDQLIIELKPSYSWIHVSYVNEEENRKQILKATFKEGQAVRYERYPLYAYGWAHER